MSYLYRPHECNLPHPTINRAIWQCERCGKVWRAVVPGNPNYAGWRLMGPIGRWLSGIRKAPP